MRRKMRKSCLLVIAALLLVLAGSAIQSEAGVSVGISIGLPPLVFAAPPEVIVLPYTSGVYVVPGIDAELYFWNGWWWRLWEGRWYRSHYYDRGWGYYYSVPSFYFDVDPGWRGYYHDHNWYGHPWNYEPIPHSRLQSNWRNWDTNRYWERQRTWGVQGLQPLPRQQRQELRQQRQQEYRQRPDVQRQIQPQVRQPRGQQPQIQQPYGQQQMQPGVRQPQQQRQIQQPQGKKQPQARQPRQQPQVQQPQGQQQMQHQGRQPRQQPQVQQRQGESRHQQSHGKAEQGDEEHRK